MNKVLNMLACWFEDPQSEQFARCADLLALYLSACGTPAIASSSLCAAKLVLLVSCRHLPRLHDYLWLAEDGMKMQGYNGSQLWDTAFAVQAFAASGMAKQFSSSLQSAHRYIRSTQVTIFLGASSTSNNTCYLSK